MALTRKEIYEKHKERYHSDPEYRAKILAQKSAYAKRRRQNPEVKEKLNQYNRDNAAYFCKKAKEYNAARPFHYAFKRLRLRAKQNNLLFDLDEEYLISIWTGKCAIFGTTLQLPYSTNRQVPDKATIDKVIPELGYVKGNVQWVSNRANTIKSYGTLEEHQMIVEYIRVNTSDKVDNHQTLVRQN